MTPLDGMVQAALWSLFGFTSLSWLLICVIEARRSRRVQAGYRRRLGLIAMPRPRRIRRARGAGRVRW